MAMMKSEAMWEGGVDIIAQKCKNLAKIQVIHIIQKVVRKITDLQMLAVSMVQVGVGVRAHWNFFFVQTNIRYNVDKILQISCKITIKTYNEMNIIIFSFLRYFKLHYSWRIIWIWWDIVAIVETFLLEQEVKRHIAQLRQMRQTQFIHMDILRLPRV